MKKKFEPPTEQEMIDFAKLRNLNVDASYLWNMWNDGDWIKANGEPIRNWKQTMWVHHRCNEERGIISSCCKCNRKPAPYIKGQDRDGHPYHYCHNHKPAPPPLPEEIREMVEPIGKIPPEKKPEPVYKLRKKLLDCKRQKR